MYCHVQQEGLCTLCHVEDMFLHEALLWVRSADSCRRSEYVSSSDLSISPVNNFGLGYSLGVEEKCFLILLSLHCMMGTDCTRRIE